MSSWEEEENFEEEDFEEEDFEEEDLEQEEEEEQVYFQLEPRTLRIIEDAGDLITVTSNKVEFGIFSNEQLFNVEMIPEYKLNGWAPQINIKEAHWRNAFLNLINLVVKNFIVINKSLPEEQIVNQIKEKIDYSTSSFQRKREGIEKLSQNEVVELNRKELIDEIFATFWSLIYNEKDFILQVYILVKHLIENFYNYCPICSRIKITNNYLPLVDESPFCLLQLFNVPDDFETDLAFKPDFIHYLKVWLKATCIINNKRKESLFPILPDDYYMVENNLIKINFNKLCQEINEENPKLIYWFSQSIPKNYVIYEDADIFEKWRINPNKWICLKTDSSPQFEQLKKGQETNLGFHGSRPENWYSILKSGLVVTSNTEYQTAGAAYGKGVYLAKDFETSISYSGSDIGSTIALCEIIPGPIQDPFYVISDSKHIDILYIFIYKG